MRNLVLYSVLISMLSTTAMAGEYTLFNPTPDNQLRAFSTDNPTKSDTPYTVDGGRFQYEAQLFNDSIGHTGNYNLLLGDTVLKAGLTRNVDAEVLLEPINVAHSGYTTTTGFGDTYLRIKTNIVGNDSGNYSVALVPYMKVPSAAPTLGNGHWEGGVYLPFTASLPADWILEITTEVDDLEKSDFTGHYSNYQNLINFGHPITSSLTGYIEGWTQASETNHSQYTADFALAWLVKDNLQLDSGINFGLNQASTAQQIYAGISQRF